MTSTIREATVHVTLRVGCDLREALREIILLAVQENREFVMSANGCIYHIQPWEIIEAEFQRGKDLPA